MKKFSHYFSDLHTLTHYLIIFVPIIFLFKHNFSNFLVSITPIIFLFLFIKYKFNFEINKVIGVFFVYILIHSLINFNINGLYYLRFLFLFILINYFIDPKKFKIFILIYKYFIVFFCFDLIFQHYFGFNIFLLENTLQIPTSFFGDEKIAGSYLYYLTIIIMLISIFSEDEKTFSQIILFSPILIFASLITTQRMPFLNYSLLLLLSIFLYFLFNKKKHLFLIKFGSIGLITLMFFILSPKKNYFYDKFNYIYNYFPNLVNEQSKKKVNLTYFNYEGFEKVKLNESVFKKISDKQIAPNTGYYLVFNYSDIFARGYLNGKWNDLRISDINTSDRFKSNKYRFVLSGDEKSEEIKRYFNYDVNEELDVLRIFDYFNAKDTYQKDQIIASFQTVFPVDELISDNGWYSHMVTAYKIWHENKLFGVGLKEFRYLCKNKKYWDMNSTSNVYCTTHPHNFFIEILSEVGIFGIILFYLIIFYIIFKIIICNIKTRDKFIAVIIIILLFQPFQITGRFFSSNVSIFNFYIISLYYYYFDKLRTK